MGDRCSVYVYVPTSRLSDAVHALQSAVYFQPTSTDNVTLRGAPDTPAACSEIWDDEVNYAGSLSYEEPSDFLGLVHANIPFCGSHNNGDNYGPGVFAYDGTTFIYTEADWYAESPIILLEMSTGSIDGSALERANTYHRTYRNVLELFRKDPS